MDMEKLKARLRRHEGLRLHPYVDSVGKLTIGFGRNLSDVGISLSEASIMLDNDVNRAINDCKKYLVFYESLDPVRKEVVTNMVFNLGIGKFLGFKKTVAALEKGEYSQAASHMQNSKWAKQVGPRSEELCRMMDKGG